MTRLAACIALACGPLAAALLTESRFADASVRALVLLALGAVFAAGAFLALNRAEARWAREAEARERSLRQARDQQTATAEILSAIAASPPDLQRVLDTIARNAARVCDGLFAAVFRFDGTMIQFAAHHGLSSARLENFDQRYPRGLDDETPTARAIRGASVIHYPDIGNDPGAPPWLRELALAERFRSLIVVPMLQEGRALGTLNVSRPEGGFTERQIQLLRAFADQAVIAIETVRLFQELQARNRELTEALEQQTATAEILQVISSSPTDLAPVMEAVTRNAARLARADHALIGEAADGRIRWLATAGCPLVSEGSPISRQLPSGRAILDCQTTQVEDVTELTEDFPGVRRAHDELGVRTILATPLVREGLAIGVLLVRRTEVRPFTGKEIELLRTFADQAVIAIENVRLFQELQGRNRELSETLEQQTATGEILRVIASSPTTLQPVLDALITSAVRLVGATQGHVRQYDGEFLPIVAHYNVSDQMLAHLLSIPVRPSAESAVGRAFVERRPCHIRDTLEDPGYRGPALGADRPGRTVLAVPLLREGAPIGTITIFHEVVQPFTKKQIALLETFADQAVIAIENVRLFQELQGRNRELTESLEQQTATSEILGVISRSPTDLQPVLEAVARNASRLCGAANVSLYRVEGTLMRKVAEQGPPLTALRVGEIRPITRTRVSGRAIVDRTTIHVADFQSADAAREYPDARRDTGIRTTIGIPLLREEVAIGAFTAYRTESRPFSAREIALLQTFADQAVIAIENVRLFQELQRRNRELSEALEQQTATSEILQVISASPTDLRPVFDAILRSAVQLCGGFYSLLFQLDGERLDLTATHNVPPEGLEALRRRYPLSIASDEGGLTARAVRERRLLHVTDIQSDPSLPAAVRRASEAVGQRAAVAVPMFREGEPVGALTVSRQEARAFSEKECALLETFAAQAVIAIENVRLFKELEARNRELTESLEQQTATSEILRVISSSPTDVQPVFDSILERAIRLADGVFGSAFSFDGERIHMIAYRGLSDEALEISRRVYPMVPGPEQMTARAVLDREVVHVRDVDTDPDVSATTREFARVIGFRSLLAVPMLREDRPIGVLTVTRATGEFSQKHIELVQTFADQAVIAIENVRLFQELGARNRELTETLEQQTATSEILQAISSSPTDAQPVFDTIARSAMRLCEGGFAVVCRYDGELMHLAAHSHARPEGVEAMRQSFPMRPSRINMAGRAILAGAVAHVADAVADPEYGQTFAATLGNRSSIGVPMLRDGRPIGAIMVGRLEVRPFADVQIALLQTFADQAVIAIENVRLFKELEARNRDLTESLEQQTATAEILRVISSSPTDVRPVFDAIATSAVRVCEAVNSNVFQFDGSMIHLMASHGVTGAELAAVQATFPIPAGRSGATARAMSTGVITHISDISADPEYGHPVLVQAGYRTSLSVPMLRDGKPTGAITVARREVRPFSDRQIALLQTFADQAVIAIENVRLFTELGARNRELTESLEQQTATSEILRAISASPTDTQPVFDTIAQRAVRVCDGTHCAVMRFDGGLVHVVAHAGLSVESVEELRRVYPLPLTADTLAVRSIREGKVIHSADMLSDPSEAVRRLAQVGRYRSGIMVPLLRTGSAVGVISVGRSDPAGGPRPFTEKEIVLLQTFADQGVIAVENVRLFRELEARTGELARSVEELQALSEVGRAVSSTLDLPTVLATIVARAVQLSGTSGGVIYEYDEAAEEFQLRASHRTEEALIEAMRATPIRLGVGATGQAGLRRVPVQVADTLDDRDFQVTPVLRSTLNQLGYRSILAIPLLLERRILGALTVLRRETGHFPQETVDLVQTFATQSALAIQNARLFREIEAKSRELEVASRHKSQFLANMSHELRTPLNAILGYTELLVDGIYGDLSSKVGDVMTRIDRSGKHLLGLINDVLDLSKIEAGQLELGLADYSLAEIVATVVTQVEALAGEKGLLLQAAVAPGLPAGRGDERRLAQVLLNLVGNAIKFTEVGSVRVAAYREGDDLVVSVADTGPGIAEADRQRIFEEFQQADSSATRKKGGTGLGLSIAKRIVELHGGQLWVDSTVGRGSTFSFRVPVRVDRQAARS